MAGVVLAALMVGTLGSTPAVGGSATAMERAEIQDPLDYWRGRGFAPMVPAIHLPTTHDADDLIQVWLRIPAGEQIDVRYLADQERYTLVYPVGTRADRVEYYRVEDRPPVDLVDYAPFRISDADPTGWTVADVRGTTLTSDGSQRFHVYRPASGETHAPLAGWAWPRGDDAAHRRATRRLAEHARSTARPNGKSPMSEEGVEALVALNDCAGCHIPNRQRISARQDKELPVDRATDAMGFLVPHAVLTDDCVVVNHRSEDLNREDPFVDVRCEDDPATLRSDDGYEYYTCPGEATPIGYRDIAAGLRADHPYTRAVCESRRYLYRHMTARAREAYSTAFENCRIP